MLNGLIGGHVANDARDRRDQRIRICTGVDEKATAKHWTLFKGAVNGERGLRNDVSVVNIGGDADDAVRRETRLFEIGPGEELQHGIRPIDMPIDRILVGEHALCESLADDDDGLFIILVIERIEIAAGNDRNAERRKESGRDDTPLRPRILFAGGMDMSVGGELQTRPAAASRQGTTSPNAVLLTPGRASMRRIASL